MDKYEHLINLKHDAAVVQTQDRAGDSVNTVKTLKPSTSTQRSYACQKFTLSGVPFPCMYCGPSHPHNFCLLRTHQCKQFRCVSRKRGFTRKRSSNNRENPSGLGSGSRLNPAHRRKFVTVYINHDPVQIQLDTASDIYVISNSTWHIIGQPPIEPISVTITSA